MPTSLMKRRTQQERTRVSRQKVIEATVSCIQRGGVTNATVSNIAAEAGMTWGTIQHQFGSKTGLFAAVVDSSSRQLIEKLDDFEVGDRSLAEVVEEFTGILWSHYSQPEFRATMEILLNRGSDREDLEGSVQDTGLQVVSLWRKIIKSAGSAASDADIGMAGEILETSLSGFAIRSSMFHQQRFNVKKLRQKLTVAVVTMLSDSD